MASTHVIKEEAYRSPYHDPFLAVKAEAQECVLPSSSCQIPEICTQGKPSLAPVVEISSSSSSDVSGKTCSTPAYHTGMNSSMGRSPRYKRPILSNAVHKSSVSASPSKRPRIFGSETNASLLQSQPPLQPDTPSLPDDFLAPLETSHHDFRALTSSQLSVPSPLPSARAMVSPRANIDRVSRQFWKAGDYEVDQGGRKGTGGGMDHVRVHPKFLHSNATSHKWALGAIAELMDNALDEVANGATFVKLDMVKNPKNGEPMLMIEDDGGGMNPDSMRQCMSLGYSAKSKIANTIGQYGNGFKTSTMRLGADVIVFSRCRASNGCGPTESIGILSYTFLRETGQQDIIVPFVDYEVQPFGLKKLIRRNVDDWNRNMEAIKRWSPYSTEADLIDQFKGMQTQGTKILIYNLWEDDEGELELDFDASHYDIQLRGANRDEKNISMAKRFPNSWHYLTYKHSLRSYASILYLRLPPSFQMFLRGKQIQHHNLIDDLMHTQVSTYRPQIAGDAPDREAGQRKAVVTVGFVKDAKEHIDVQGFNVYHKNRLIKPFWRIWNSASSGGRGVVGVLEANFVEPAHDKQGFERTVVLARLENRLLEMQRSYWSKNCHKVGYVNQSLKEKNKKTSQGGPTCSRVVHMGPCPLEMQQSSLSLPVSRPLLPEAPTQHPRLGNNGTNPEAHASSVSLASPRSLRSHTQAQIAGQGLPLRHNDDQRLQTRKQPMQQASLPLSGVMSSMPKQVDVLRPAREGSKAQEPAISSRSPSGTQSDSYIHEQNLQAVESPVAQVVHGVSSINESLISSERQHVSLLQAGSLCSVSDVPSISRSLQLHEACTPKSMKSMNEHVVSCPPNSTAQEVCHGGVLEDAHLLAIPSGGNLPQAAQSCGSEVQENVVFANQSTTAPAAESPYTSLTQLEKGKESFSPNLDAALQVSLLSSSVYKDFHSILHQKASAASDTVLTSSRVPQSSSAGHDRSTLDLKNCSFLESRVEACSPSHVVESTSPAAVTDFPQTSGSELALSPCDRVHDDPQSCDGANPQSLQTMPRNTCLAPSAVLASKFLVGSTCSLQPPSDALPQPPVVRDVAFDKGPEKCIPVGQGDIVEEVSQVGITSENSTFSGIAPTQDAVKDVPVNKTVNSEVHTVTTVNHESLCMEIPEGQGSALTRTPLMSVTHSAEPEKRTSSALKANAIQHARPFFGRKFLEELGRQFAKQAVEVGKPQSTSPKAICDSTFEPTTALVEAKDAITNALVIHNNHLPHGKLEYHLAELEEEVKVLQEKLDLAIVERDILRQKLEEEKLHGQQCKEEMQKKVGEAWARVRELEARTNCTGLA